MTNQKLALPAEQRPPTQRNGIGARSTFPRGDAHPPKAAQRFVTMVGGDRRTTGIALFRPDYRAVSLAELDLEHFSRAALGGPTDAAARGKLLVIGHDGAAVFQCHPGRVPELVVCGQATLAVAAVLGLVCVRFTLFAPNERSIRVFQSRSGALVEQAWTISDFNVGETVWRGCPVALCTGANAYAVVRGPLPRGISPAQARSELVGDTLGAKLALLEPSDCGVPLVTNYNAGGTHGAIAASALLTLAMLRLKSPSFAAILRGESIMHPSKSGVVEVLLPQTLATRDAHITVSMPIAEINLTGF